MSKTFDHHLPVYMLLNVSVFHCSLKVIAIKAPGFGERKSSYLEDIAILTGAQVVKDEVGLSIDKVGRDLLFCTCAPQALKIFLLLSLYRSATNLRKGPFAYYAPSSVCSWLLPFLAYSLEKLECMAGGGC